MANVTQEPKYLTKEEVLKRAQEAINIPLGDIDKTGRLQTGKGAIGTVLEESWFGYTPNSKAEPDFPEAGVELKVTPYLKTYNRRNTQFDIRAKERLVCNIINYMTEYNKTFYTSDFWHKCETMLIMSYEHKPNCPKAEFTIDRAILFSFPMEDLIIIEHDWETIINKIRAGQAHLITEGDTLYLAACTKGASAASVRQQPFSDIPAKQRAYSLKSSYMTSILNRYVFGAEEDEHIIKDWHDIAETDFKKYIQKKLKPYIGRTTYELAQEFGVEPRKSYTYAILSGMLGIKGNIRLSSEFKKAGIVPKTVRLDERGRSCESMSFPTFKFTEIVEETWEESTLRGQLEPTIFMFVVFKETDDYTYSLRNKNYVFKGVHFWNMPADDLEEVHQVWEKTVQTIKEGVQLTRKELSHGYIIQNNLPKPRENRVAHVRPHATSRNDTYPLPDGREMTKQSFWLKDDYVSSILDGVIEGLED